MSRRVLLYHLDGLLPNVALMRIAAHYRALGDSVELRVIPQRMQQWIQALEPKAGDDPRTDLVYASAVFKGSVQRIEYMRTIWQNLTVGGTGVDIRLTLEDVGITTTVKDYSIYPEYRWSIGWTQQGCRRNCPFCVVPIKEGLPKRIGSLRDIWRGDPFPRGILLLDNDFFSNDAWSDILREAVVDNFAVSFTQGINLRTLTPEQACAMALVNYRDLDMIQPYLYGAWDNTKDERLVFRGIKNLVDAGVNVKNICVYMLIGFHDGEQVDDWEYRRSRIMAVGARAYPMVFDKSNRLANKFRQWAARRACEYMTFTDFATKFMDKAYIGTTGPIPKALSK